MLSLLSALRDTPPIISVCDILLRDLVSLPAARGNYRVRDWLILSLLNFFAGNDSNQGVCDYSVADRGGGVVLTVRF